MSERNLCICCTGNALLAKLTAARQYQLRIDLWDWEGNTRYAVYTNFNVNQAKANYNLSSLGTYSGDAGIGYRL